MSKLHRNILIVLLYIGVVMIIVSAYIIGKHEKPHDPYVQWPNAINTLEAEKQIDCDGEIIWIQQSDAYGNDTSFPVCSQQEN